MWTVFFSVPDDIQVVAHFYFFDSTAKKSSLNIIYLIRVISHRLVFVAVILIMHCMVVRARLLYICFFYIPTPNSLKTICLLNT